MGIQPWTKRPPPVSSLPLSELDWQALQERVSKCQACALHKGRTNTVFGVGDPNADLLIVGEAPGFHEDRLGEPFVGRAGQLLNAMLHAIDLEREQVFIANVLKCRPPNNRDPAAEEVAQCTTYLQRQMVLLQPKLILAVGRIAAHYLLESEEPLARLRGRRFSYGPQQIPLFVTYHPAYLLRSPRDKRKAYQDLLKVRQYLQ